MARPSSSQPTEVELQILRTLWARGGGTARQIHIELADVEARETTYSTTVKMLSVMLEKGLVKRDESVTPQLYTAAVSQKVTQRKMLGDLIDKLYDGSAFSLVLQALASRKASQEELTELRRLVNELERKAE